MTTAVEHPRWCDPGRCKAAAGGLHESEPVRVTGIKGNAPRILLLLNAPVALNPVRMRMVTIGDLLINVVDIDLDGGALLAAHIHKLIASAAPLE